MKSTYPAMFAVRLRSDSGNVMFRTTARDAVDAARIATDQQLAPMRSVQWVARQPTCDYCDKWATRRVRDSSDVVCRDCARAQTDGPLRDYVLPLAVTQWPREPFAS